MAFRDPLDEEADAAEASITSKHAKAHAARAAEPDEDTTEVEIKEEDEESDPEVIAPSRKDKRAARMSAREAAIAEKARADAYKEQLEIAQRARAEAPPAQRQENAVAQIDQRINGIYDQLDSLQSELDLKAQTKTLTKEIEQDYVRRARALDIEKNTLIKQRADAIDEPRRRAQDNTERQRARFPDVYNNPRAIAYAAGKVNMLGAQGIPVDTEEMHDQIMEETRQVILGKRTAPDAASRQRATGMSSARQTVAGAAAPRLSMPKGSPLYKMACAAYPQLEPAQACQKWANTHGKKMVGA